VPLGAGLAPNLISGNVEAAVIYSPLSFKVIKDGDGRSILDYGAAMPAHLNSGFAASDAFIDEKPELLKKTVKALLGGLAYLQDNRESAVKLIAEINDIPADIAEQEYENVFLKLSRTGEMTLAEVEQAFDLYRLGGMKDFPPAADMFTNDGIPGAN